MPECKKNRLSKFWVYTLNNYTDDEVSNLQDHFSDTNEFNYAIFGYETGERGTKHLQGYFVLRKGTGLGAIKELGKVFARMHLEIRRGTEPQAITYCKKDGKYEEFGQPSVTSNNDKIGKLELREMALEGGSRAIARDPRCTLHNLKTARALLEEIEPARDANSSIEVVWYFGKTGIGKSRRARHEAINEFGEEEVYRKAESSKWFNGYDRHKAVIIDDYRDSWWAFTEILRLLDRYPTQVEIKGGMRQWVPYKIWVTSAHSPRVMYSGVGEDIQQLVRRCTTIEEIVFNWTPCDPYADTILCNSKGQILSRSSSNASINSNL